MSKKYLKTFFAEKSLPEQAFEIVDKNGTPHWIDTEVVKEAIFNASPDEIETISNTIRMIDFKNGDVNHYLKHLATALVNNYSE